jgi:hypothetical protein
MAGIRRRRKLATFNVTDDYSENQKDKKMNYLQVARKVTKKAGVKFHLRKLDFVRYFR